MRFQNETTTTTVPDVTDDTKVLRVTVRMDRGFSYWTRPDAATLRRQVDMALRGTGYRRVGRATEVTPGDLTWCFLYSIEKVAA